MQGIIIAATTNTARTGRKYCTLTIQDIDCKSVINIWGAESKDFPVGKFVVIVKPTIDDKGTSCKKEQVSIQEPPESYTSFLPPIPTREKWDALQNNLSSLMREFGVAQDLLDFFANEMTRMFPMYMQTVAGRVNHHHTKGGLAEHTYEIMNMFYHIYHALPWKVDPFILSYAALMHDAAKVFCYAKDTFEYTEYGTLVNHVAGSADMAMQAMRKCNIPSKIMMHVQHCILAHHELLEYGSPVRPSTIEAEILAMLDRISGHGTQIVDNASFEGTRVSNLETTVYKTPNTII